MPVDLNGNRADIIMDGDSTIKRMNVARMYEQHINATNRDLAVEIRRDFGYDSTQPHNEQIERFMSSKHYEPTYVATFERLLRYYTIISPKMAELVVKLGKNKSDVKNHVNSILKDGIYIWLPTDNPAEPVNIIAQLRKEFPIHIGPVKYRGRSGKECETFSNILIGSMYIMLLEKTGSEWSSVSSPKLQHFGIPAKLTNADKYSTPVRANPVRITGESEVRLLCATIGGDATEELLNQSNDPSVHKEIVRNILTADKPSNIEKIIDRTQFPRGKSRPLVYTKHILECAGIEFTND